ncbi:hypothetical protein [Musicola paradisiaca]|uniref:Uncharacterized protein n=1 Tax=Musicola paradisiaca (strain Ech703) TaxID=579405 RepID=C6CAS4_MUSP7|nr:hypothetical protein [Musicola paradisiaca]ACS84624.1 hypothetical protein Dd703_0813 [Musicola paradisiaca Ech703]
MDISLSLNAIVDSLVYQNKIKREKVGEYLEAVARDAQLLAEIWEKVWWQLHDVELNLSVDIEEKCMEDLAGIFPQLSKKYSHFNSRVYGRLEEFYLTLSSAVGGKVNLVFHDNFCFHLASLIHARKKSHDYIKFLDSSRFINIEQCNDAIHDGKILIEILYKEANKLDSLAKLYRANGQGTD